MNKNKIIILVVIGLVAFVAWKVFGPTVSAPEGKYFYIRTGSTFNDVKEGLLKEHIIGGSFFFEKTAGMLHYTSAVKAGRYEIRNGMSIFNLVRMLRSGNQSPVNLVIIKLRTPEGLASLIAKNFECDSVSVMKFLSNPDSIARMGLDSNTVMTAIIPNTYGILWNSSFPKLFKKIQAEQEKFWTTERKQKATSLNLTPIQAYILASIVEDETTKQEDKGKIASVYLNRLETGMFLGADPTVIFALKDYSIRRVLNGHKEVQSPYNTYLHKGLPPGPVCTPSIKTIDATLNAPTTGYLYFVAQPNLTGFSNFSTDYQQHMIYAKAYQAWLTEFLKTKQAAAK
ncbi:MAG: endolytic transglycosylase MltG [Ferruginibacter sp.]